MTYLFIYVVGIISIWWIYRVGWLRATKLFISVLIPSILIVLFNVKAGRLLFKSPLVGLISVLPTTLFIYRGSKPLVESINSWIDQKINFATDSKEVVDAEVLSKEDA